MKKIIYLFLLCTGCASTPSYFPYAGEPREWPLGDQPFAKSVKGVPLFIGAPSQSYDVLGQFTYTASPNIIETQLAWLAKSKGGDAIVIGNVSTSNGGSMTFGGGSSTSIQGTVSGGQFTGNAVTTANPTFTVPKVNNTVSGYVIKWKTPQR